MRNSSRCVAPGCGSCVGPRACSRSLPLPHVRPNPIRCVAPGCLTHLRSCTLAALMCSLPPLAVGLSTAELFLRLRQFILESFGFTRYWVHEQGQGNFHISSLPSCYLYSIPSRRAGLTPASANGGMGYRRPYLAQRQPDLLHSSPMYLSRELYRRLRETSCNRNVQA